MYVIYFVGIFHHPLIRLQLFFSSPLYLSHCMCLFLLFIDLLTLDAYTRLFKFCISAHFLVSRAPTCEAQKRIVFFLLYCIARCPKTSKPVPRTICSIIFDRKVTWFKNSFSYTIINTFSHQNSKCCQIRSFFTRSENFSGVPDQRRRWAIQKNNIRFKYVYQKW